MQFSCTIPNLGIVNQNRISILSHITSLLRFRIALISTKFMGFSFFLLAPKNHILKRSICKNVTEKVSEKFDMFEWFAHEMQ